jgi:transaldolase
MVGKKMDIYLDSAKLEDIQEGIRLKEVKGFTTNPSLMKAAGIRDYAWYAHVLINTLKDERPDTTLSLEVFADDMEGMEYQARRIHSWAEGYPVYIKIPVTNTHGYSTAELVGKLNSEGIRINVTAVFTEAQTKEILKYIRSDQDLIISVFAGRIADTMRSPFSNMHNHIVMRHRFYHGNNVKLLWASCRQVYSFAEAEIVGCDIITMTLDQIKKRAKLYQKDLTEYSLETVKQFYNDAKESGFTID